VHDCGAGLPGKWAWDLFLNNDPNCINCGDCPQVSAPSPHLTVMAACGREGMGLHCDPGDHSDEALKVASMRVVSTAVGR
jgi:hypothetical protein